jgi:predicted transcriptional regulator
VTDLAAAPAVEVARELQQPLEELARAMGQPPARIVNQALAEYLERRLRPDRESSGSSASYIEMTAREDRDDVF